MNEKRILSPQSGTQDINDLLKIHVIKNDKDLRYKK